MGLLSLLFFAGLKSNITILGPWFLVGLTMCIPLIYITFYLLGEGLERGSFRFLLVASLILMAISLIHPCSASFIYPVLILYLILRLRLIRKNIYGLICFFSIPFMSFIYFIKFFWKGELTKTMNFFIDYLTFPVKEFLAFEYYLFTPRFYGQLPLILAAIGIFCIYALNRNREKILVSWSMLTLGSMFLFYHLKFTIISPYERTLYYHLISLAPLSAIGLYWIFRGIYELKKYVHRAVPTMICLILAWFIFTGYFTDYHIYKPDLYTVINEEDYAALKWMETQGITHKKVLAQPHTSFAVYAISRNSIIARSSRGRAASKTLKDVNTFFKDSNCEEKQEIIDKYKVDYILSPTKIKCGKMEEIYNKGRYIYKITR